MTGLTQVAITARKSIRYIIYFIVFLTIGRILLTAAIATYLRVFPPGPAAASVKFGKLTKIPFPQNSPNAKLNFTLETATGSLPTNNGQAKVYFMPKVNPNLLSLDNAKSKARSMGFNDPNPIQESDTLYKFRNADLPSTLEMNIVTGAFSISYDLTADRTAIINRPPAAEVAEEEFKSILSGASILPEDLSGPMVPDYLKLESGALARVLALSEADVTKVNIFRKPYNKLPSLTASPDKANVWAMIGGGQTKEQKIIASEYHYFPVDESQSSTYPIITPAEAFSALQEGKAFIASLGQYKEGDALKIRKVYLAYFDPEVPSDFYEPIYVFDSGENDPDNSFIGYIPAITSVYYGD